MKLLIVLAVIVVAFAFEQTTAEPKPACAGKNTVWKECSNACGEKNCDNFMNVGGCFSLRCGAAACVCKEGHVFLSAKAEDGCVRREVCMQLQKLKSAQQSTARRALRL